jgi:ABC-2 type transport system ATP-binding protein
VPDPALGVAAYGVWRRFGKVEALRGLDVTAPYGQVTALIGPRGAGKSTLLLILATLLAPDSGDVLVAGADPRADRAAVRAAAGWMPDAFGRYERLLVREYLDFFGRACGLSVSAARTRRAELLDLVRLDEAAGQPVHVLSRWQQQRLGLARALVHRPAVLLADEPVSGLDPPDGAEMQVLLRRLATEGAAVLASSGTLTDLADAADRAVFVNQGETTEAREIAEVAMYGRRSPPPGDARQ